MANLGNCGHAIISPLLIRATIPMPVVGSIRSVISKTNTWAHKWYSSSNPPGMGNSFTVPTLNKVVLTLQGRYVDTAQGGSGAVFYDVAPGIYYAYELNGSACWKVEITSSTITVTPQSSGGGGGGTSASAYVLT